MNTRAFLYSGAAVLALMTGGAAFAQDGQPEDGVTTVDALVITVERREQSLQDVPLAVTAVDDEMRNTLGVLTIQDMAEFTPGVSYNTTLDRPTIRGIGRQSNSFTLDSPVANYFDGIYTSSVQDASRRPIFIARTEILRGPQGALSGRGSIGGAINTLSKRPYDFFEIEAGLQAGDYSRYGYEATMTGPITSWLRGRANVGRYFQDDGYFTNVAFPASEGDQPNNRQIYDLMLEGDLGDSIDFFFKAAFADYDESRRTGAPLAPYSGGGSSVCSPSAFSGGLVPNAAFGLFSAIPEGCGVTSGNPVNSGGVVLGGVTTNPVTPGNLRLYNSDITSRQKLDDHHVYLGEVNWQGPGFDVRYVGGHQNYIYTQVTDADGTPVTEIRLPNAFGGRRVFPGGTNMYQEEREWFSHELNAASSGDGRFQWIVGLYQSFEDFRQEPATQIFTGYPELNTPLDATTFSPFDLAGNPVSANAEPFRAQYGEVFGQTRSSAIYGQGDFVLNDRWKFTLGLRYNKDEKEALEQTRLIYNNLGILAGAGFGVPLSLDITLDQAPGFALIDPGDVVPPGFTVFDPSGLPVVAGRHVLPNGGGFVPVGQQVLLAPGAVGLPTTDADGNRVRALAAEWSAVTGSLGVDFTPNDDTLIYGRYARGYRPGGFNAFGFITATPTVDEETVDSFEVGAKQVLWNQLQLNTTAFLYDYRDVQQPLATFERCLVPGDFSSCTAVNSFVNLPSAETKGLELEALWFATDNLQITFNYGYLDARIKDGRTDVGFEDPLDPSALLPTAQRLLPINCTTVSGSCRLTTTDEGVTGLFEHDSLTNAVRYTQDLSDNPLQNSPRHKFFLNGAYTFDNWMPGDLTLSGTWIWRDEAYNGLFGSEIDKAPSYSQVNLRAVWRDRRDFTVVVFVNNVFDEAVSESIGLTRRNVNDPLVAGAITTPNVTYYPTYNLAPPRTFGVELFKRF